MPKYIETNECFFSDLKDLYELNKTEPVGIIYKVLNIFENTLLGNEIFLSESDLQFSFAQKVKDLGAKNVILEYPILTQHLYKEDKEYYNDIKNAVMQSYPNPQKESKCPDKKCFNFNNCNDCFRKQKFKRDRTFIDLYFKYDEKDYFVEFKYKLSDKDICSSVCRYDSKNEFFIKNQGAHNIGRHEIYEDIERMEHIKFLKSNASSFVVLITNDSQYWRLNGDENGNNSKYSDYRLAAKIKDECNNYQILPYRHNIIQHTENCNKNKKSLEYRGDVRHRALFLNYKYNINWANFKQIRDTVFKALVIDCNNPV